MTLSNQPLVSVVIPVYNGSNYLKEAIESVLDQTYPNLEIIVVNDGSTDHGLTRKVAQSFGNKIRYIEQPNGGVSSALNRGIAEMTGSFLSWLSHDDLFEKEKIRRQIQLIQEEVTGDYIIYSDFQYISPEGEPLDKESGIKEIAQLPILVQLLTAYPINGCTTLIPKEIFDRVGLFDTSLRTTQDYDFWFRCQQASVRFRFMKDKLLLSRLHPNQGMVVDKRHHRNCDFLYGNMLYSMIESDEELTEKESRLIIRSLIKRKFYSAASMGLGLLKSKWLKQYFFLVMFLNPVFSILRGSR